MNTLKIKIVNDESNYLAHLYHDQIEKLNKDIQYNEYIDSGFDLYTPENLEFISASEKKTTKKLDLKIQCAMYDASGNPSAFYMYPRSSISKTPFRLANNTGIIDSGYRGNLGGVFDIHNLPADKAPYEQYQRLVQICSNTLEPFKVILVDDIDKLGTTERGEGGFGSTGV